MTTHRMPAMPTMPGKAGATHGCACGCGMPTARTWHPGHDGRATGWAIRIERRIITADQIPANERAGAAIMIKRRADARARADQAQPAAKIA